jgi:hypothetical protein
MKHMIAEMVMSVLNWRAFTTSVVVCVLLTVPARDVGLMLKSRVT